MLDRVLEPEVMDTPEEARDYDAMDHAAVNGVFAADFLAFWDGRCPVLDLGTGTAQIPIALCRRCPDLQIVAVDMAEHMLRLAETNVRQAGLEDRIRLERGDAKRLPWPDGFFPAVISNSIVHHIPDPGQVLAEAVRLTAADGCLFFRDLLRPPDEKTWNHLVQTYAGDANEHQRQMFGDSLRAALTLDEVRLLVSGLGFDSSSVQQTTDRHWTWRGRKK